MTTPQFRLGIERKIGYSFLGLLVGNAAMLIALLLLSVFRDYPFLAKLRHSWYLTPEQALDSFLMFAIFALFGWIVVGLPFILVLPANVASRLHWSASILIGAILGVLALYLIFDRGRFDRSNLWDDPTFFWQAFVFASAAALNSAVAFTTYCTLIQSARLTREMKTAHHLARRNPSLFSN